MVGPSPPQPRTRGPEPRQSALSAPEPEGETPAQSGAEVDASGSPFLLGSARTAQEVRTRQNGMKVK